MTAELTYLTFSAGKYGTISDLISTKLTDSSFPSKGGYVYSIDLAAGGGDYTIWAAPISTNYARYAYYTVPDGMVRYCHGFRLRPLRTGRNGG